MTIKTMMSRGASASQVARLLGVTEGTVRYRVRRMRESAADGRSQTMKAEALAEAIAHWREQQGDGPINLAALHAWLRCEHGYDGSLRTVQRFWSRTYPPTAIRARRRIETPMAAQTQVDWAGFRAWWSTANARTCCRCQCTKCGREFRYETWDSAGGTAPKRPARSPR